MYKRNVWYVMSNIEGSVLIKFKRSFLLKCFSERGEVQTSGGKNRIFHNRGRHIGTAMIFYPKHQTIFDRVFCFLSIIDR